MPRVDNKNCDFSSKDRLEILKYLKSNSETFNRRSGLKYGTMLKAQKKFKCSKIPLQQIWRRALEAWESGEVPVDEWPDVSSLKKKGNGIKRINREELKERLRKTPMRKRQTIRSTAAAAGLRRALWSRLLAPLP